MRPRRPRYRGIRSSQPLFAHSPDHNEAMVDHRLRRSSDVRAVLDAGSRVHGRAAVLHARARGDGDPARWTVVAGRKLGSAVQRNRAKRRLRGVLRDALLPAGTDLVVVARPASLTAGPAALRAELDQLLERVAGAGVRR